jgi:hypothetical protein
VTETQWLEAVDLDAMLVHLRRRASSRKLRLFACACCRQVWHLLRDPRAREAVEVSERYADSRVTARRLATAAGQAREAADGLRFEASLSMSLAKWAARDATVAAALTAEKRPNVSQVARLVRSAVTFTPERPKDQCDLLRDLFRPFRQAVDSGSLPSSSGSPVLALARTIYDERRFADLPVLADALEEAGCTDAEVLTHCRRGGEHGLGCWALDLILARR